jgi:hypothetical protein
VEGGWPIIHGPPGDVGEFALDITGSELGESILELGWVAEGITWFSEPPKGGGPPDGYFAVEVNVVEATDGSSGVGGGSSGAGGGDGFHADSPEGDDSGCSCRVGAHHRPAIPAGLLAACVGIAAVVARRRRPVRCGAERTCRRRRRVWYHRSA